MRLDGVCVARDTRVTFNPRILGAVARMLVLVFLVRSVFKNRRSTDNLSLMDTDSMWGFVGRSANAAAVVEEGVGANDREIKTLRKPQRRAVLLTAFLAFLCLMGLIVEGVFSLLTSITTDSDFLHRFADVLAAYRNCSWTNSMHATAWELWRVRGAKSEREGGARTEE